MSHTGEYSVTVRTTGHDKGQFTVEHWVYDLQPGTSLQLLEGKL